MTTAENFGERLRTYRKENLLTQKQMADLIGVSVNHIGTLENGKKKPRASTIAAFEEVVGKSNWKNWRQLGEAESMENNEMMVYSQIWKGLKSLDPEREREVLDTFTKILDWL